MTARARNLDDPQLPQSAEVDRTQGPGTALDSGAAADTVFDALRERVAAARRQRESDAEPVTDAPSGAVDARLAQAAAVADVGVALPPFAHLSLPRRLLARATGRVLLYLLRVITIDQQHFNHLVLGALRALLDNTGELRGQSGALHGQVGALHDRVGALHGQIDGLHGQIDGLHGQIDGLHGQIGALRDQISALALAGDERRRVADQLDRLTDAIAAQRELLRAQNATLGEARETMALLLLQTDVLKRRLATASAGIPAASADRGIGDQARSQPLPIVDLLFYTDAFRGSEASIAARQQRYLPYFSGRDNVLDVGCGRGEFLRLLHDSGVRAHGVELDAELALSCQERGLEVRCADAIEYLAALPEGTLGGIFCAQVVEHMQSEALLRFVALAQRTLQAGAPMVIETLNPESLLVLYRWFWMDLTHVRLVHPETLQLLMRAQGFRDVSCELLPPPPGPLYIPPLQFAADPPPQLPEFNAATQYLNQLLYASFDYFVAAVR
jgi:O-antigen chain-terminating methyltransferase